MISAALDLGGDGELHIDEDPVVRLEELLAWSGLGLGFRVRVGVRVRVRFRVRARVGARVTVG